MMPLDLQDILVEEIKSLFDSQLFPRVAENTDDHPDPVPLNIFKQALPYESNGDLTVYAPYIIIQIQKGRQDEETEPEEAVILMNAGIYSDDEQNQGHVFVCNILETIRQHLFAKRTFGGKYFIKLPFEWQLNDEDVWPYFFGSAETHWNIALILPDDPNL
jgi:hypothetical protein